MNETLHFLEHHGGMVLLAVVFVEQLGVPLPSIPWLLAAGALVHAGKFNVALGLCCALAGALLGDVIWFFMGRVRGRRVLSFVCRCSLEPDSCVRRTENVYLRHKVRGVVLAKFLPGVSTLMPPLAGIFGLSLPRFLALDGLGAVLYIGCYIGLGFLFAGQLAWIGLQAARFGTGALILVVVIVAAYLGFKYSARRRLLRRLRVARITPEELRQKQMAGENLVIVDLRSPLDFEHDPHIIPGAQRIRVDEMEDRHQDIPRDRDVVLYCSCPNETTSARMALLFHRKGIMRVRPLAGGIDAWRQRDYPIEPHPERASAMMGGLVTKLSGAIPEALVEKK